MPALEQTDNSAVAPLSWKTFLGIGLLRFELILFGVALAVSALFWLLAGENNVGPTLVFTFIAGNLTAVWMEASSPFFTRFRGAVAWIVYLVLLIPVGALGSLLATCVLLALYRYKPEHLSAWIWKNLLFGTLISVATGVALYSVMRTRLRLEERNRTLQQEVEIGTVRLNAQAADLTTAHEIQTHLLPRELPSLPGVQVAVAWQPAQSVGGDYFDALLLDHNRVALCIADVAGKGISAALLMANLQAAFRAFAPQCEQPAALCAKLNQTLCGTIAAARFVTLFYCVFEADSGLLRYENAGHSPPILLRDGQAISLSGGGLVLGLFPDSVYTDRSFKLLRGDCLLLTTDGITEAADAAGEEFGEQRVIDGALRARSLGAYAIRTRILEDVTAYCGAQFADDASLIVMTLD